MGIEITTLVEHRCAVRHPVEMDVTVRPGSTAETVRGRLVNISASGACVELDADCQHGRVVELLGPGPMPWPALVVHREGTMLGLMFDRSHQQDVQGLIGRHSGGPGSPAVAA